MEIFNTALKHFKLARNATKRFLKKRNDPSSVVISGYKAPDRGHGRFGAG